MENVLEKIKEKQMEEKEDLSLYCSVHPTEVVIAFCDNCQKAVCFDCSREMHKDHKCFKMENKAVASKTNIPKLSADIHGKKIPELVRSLSKIKQSRLQLTKTDEVIDKIHKRANELMAIVMEERDIYIEQCKESRSSQEKYCQIEENILRRFLDLYNVSLKEASDVVKSKNNIELVMFESKLNSQIRDFKPRPIRSLSTPTFKPGKSERAVVRNMLGSLICDRNFEDMKMPRDDLIGIQTKLVSSIRYSCLNISSFCFQKNDMAWVNPVESRVGAVIDSKGTEHKRFDFSFDFTDMTVTDRNTIIATDTINQRIVRITNNGIVKEIASTAPLQPHGICCCKNGDLLVTQMYKADPKSIDSKRLVQRLDKDHNVKLTIQYTDSFFNKKSILTHPRRVAENLNGDIIVIDLVSETSGKVFAFDFVGKMRFSYDGNQRKSKFFPFDVCCESDLRIFVSDYFNHEINVLSCDGQFIQEISTSLEGLLNPVAVALDRKCRLWVGGKGGKILIYRYK